NVKDALAAADMARGKASEVLDVTQVLPPVVEIVSPADAKVELKANQKLEIKVEARSQGKHPVTSLLLLVDGRPLPGEQGLLRVVPPQQEVKATLAVELPTGQHHLQVVARPAVRRGVSEQVSW